MFQFRATLGYHARWATAPCSSIGPLNLRGTTATMRMLTKRRLLVAIGLALAALALGIPLVMAIRQARLSAQAMMSQ